MEQTLTALQKDTVMLDSPFSRLGDSTFLFLAIRFVDTLLSQPWEISTCCNPQPMLSLIGLDHALRISSCQQLEAVSLSHVQESTDPQKSILGNRCYLRERALPGPPHSLGKG